LIDGKLLEGLHKPVWPVHFEIKRSVISEAEMKPRIVRGIKAGLTQDALSLLFSPIMCKNPSPDRAPIGLNSLEFDLNPILFSMKIVTQKGRILIQVYDQHVDVAVIVKIPERASAAAVRFGNTRASSFDQFLERVIA